MKLRFDSPAMFQEKHVPQDASLIGMSALVHRLNVEAPVRKPACVSSQRIKQNKKDTGDWKIFDSKYAVESTIEAHLVFALRHEDLDLLVLKRIFMAIPDKALVAYVRSAPTGPLVRRIWFLYEYLTEKILGVPDSGKVSNVDLLDGDQYFVVSGTVSARHRVRNNLLGTRQFCPVIRRTETLNSFVKEQLAVRAQSILSKVNPVLIARAASFLLWADTQASFAIEGERLPINTRERWLKAVQQVGKHPLSKEELNRLHSILIGDYRFMKPGLRDDFVFLGQRTTDNEALPEFIGARPQDLDDLTEGLIEANSIMGESSLDAVLQATAIAFGFVYIHPFEDGNGRLHRCLIHHALAEKKFSPPGLVFPVSSVMLKWMDQYRTVLQSHSAPLMNFIQWVPTIRGNVDVRNDTVDLYRYFDCTEAAEFLYRCVEESVDKDVPHEIDYLKRHDKAMQQITDIVEMPNRMAENFIMFMRQNEWKLPKKRRHNEFGKLTDPEVETLQAVVQEAFEGFDKI
ncbi:MAG: Fic family protein [Candidatus Melainabacteria bacterium]|nr:Fic family protein [Candidatus Melainabacteria bacterium]